MIAADTNVVVRYLVNDDPSQSPRARRFLVQETVWLPLTVIMETAWVLRSTYRFTRQQVATTLRGLAGLPNVTIERADLVAQSLAWCDHGMHFADTLHLAAAGHCATFATFDTALARAAADAPGAPPVRAL